jgi:Na+/H+ antiporter NhaD/arsenite permease-like protein
MFPMSKPSRRLPVFIFVVALAGAPDAAHAASALGDIVLPWPWALPFAGLLLSIATGPRIMPKIWRGHCGKIAFMWGALAVTPLAALYGTPTALAALTHAVLAEYLSFIALILALYVVAGGILVTGSLRGTPLVNAAILAFGTAMASVVGTTGAAVILIRPLLRANAARLHNVHVVVFFIFLVANIGGALSPLGDPPLFAGFLRGVDFFWTTTHLAIETAAAAGLVLAAFIVTDLWLYRRDRRITVVGEPEPNEPVRIRGLVNLPLIALIAAAMLWSAVWTPGVAFTIHGTTLKLQDIGRDAALILIAVASLAFTPVEHRESNGFSWEPLLAVAKLFAGIFVCLIPVLAMLQAGRSGPFSWLLAPIAGAEPRVAYFWLTGILSAFLDNAPTYPVFFELAGGDAARLMGEFAPTLAAISTGAVYMGALTYIGNAPNLMIHAIAEERGVKMPGFFGYMLWSAAVLLPVCAILTVWFAMPS